MSETSVATLTLSRWRNSLPTRSDFLGCICVQRRMWEKNTNLEVMTSDQTPFISCVTLGRLLCLSDLGFLCKMGAVLL